MGSIEIFFTLYLKYGYQPFDLGKYDKLVNALRSYDEGLSEEEVIKRARLIYDKQCDEVIEESLEKLIELNPLIYGKIHLLHKIFPKQLNKVMKKKENASKLAKLLQQMYKIKLSSLEKERIHTIIIKQVKYKVN